MQANDLDVAYTALAEAIGRTEQLGADKTQLMLATLALSLIAKIERTDEALALITQAENLTNDSK